MISETPQSLKKLKATELRDKCQSLGIDSKGTKQTMLERLYQHYGMIVDESNGADSLSAEKIIDVFSNDIDTITDKIVSSSSSPQPVLPSQPPLKASQPSATDVNGDDDWLEPHDDGRNDLELDYNNEDDIQTASHARIERSGSDDSYMKINETELANIKSEIPFNRIISSSENYEVKYMSHVHLDPYVNDIHFTIEDDKYLTGSQITKNELSHFWTGVKATHGIDSGSVYFTCKLVGNTGREDGFLRVGFSSLQSSLHLGDSKHSCGYDSTGKIYSNMKVVGTGKRFSVGDSITVLVNITPPTTIFSFFLNDEDVGHTINVDMDQPHALFPHVYFKNVKFTVDFSPRANFPKYKSFDTATDLVTGPRPPPTFDDSELIIMVGVMGAGKTTYVKKMLNESSKRYDIIGRSALFDRWRLIGGSGERSQHLSERLVSQALMKLISVAHTRARNYIIDQTNYMASTRKKRLGFFNNFGRRRAIVVMPRLSELDRRITEYKNSLTDSNIDNRSINLDELSEFKENITLPTLEEGFTEISYVDCDEKTAQEVLDDYKYDARRFKSTTNSANVEKAKKMITPKFPRILPPKDNDRNHDTGGTSQNRMFRKYSPVKKSSPTPPHKKKFAYVPLRDRSPIRPANFVSIESRNLGRTATTDRRDSDHHRPYDYSYSNSYRSESPRVSSSRRQEHHPYYNEYDRPSSSSAYRAPGREASDYRHEDSSRRPTSSSRPMKLSPHFEDSGYSRRQTATSSHAYEQSTHKYNNHHEKRYLEHKSTRSRYDDEMKPKGSTSYHHHNNPY